MNHPARLGQSACPKGFRKDDGPRPDGGLPDASARTRLVGHHRKQGHKAAQGERRGGRSGASCKAVQVIPCGPKAPEKQAHR